MYIQTVLCVLMYIQTVLCILMYIQTVLCVLVYCWFGQEIGLVRFLIFHFRLHMYMADVIRYH